MGELAEAGCVAFSQADVPLADTQVLLRAMQYASTFGHRVWLRAAGPAPRRAAASRTTARSRRASACPAFPRAAETIALATILALVRETGVRVHLCRLSSGGGRGDGARREEGRPAGHLRRRASITCTCPTSTSAGSTSQAHLVPPLRTTRDRAALRAGVADGTIDVVCSDHAPVDDDGKQVPFGEAEPGATGLELLLPLTLKWAPRRASRFPTRWHASRAAGPRPRHRGGHAGRGAPADVCVFDPEATGGGARNALSQGKNTPFAGLELAGRARWTLVGGEIVHGE